MVIMEAIDSISQKAITIVIASSIKLKNKLEKHLRLVITSRDSKYFVLLVEDHLVWLHIYKKNLVKCTIRKQK